MFVGTMNSLATCELNKALDEVIVVDHAGEACRMVREGYEPLLKNKRGCLRKRPENLTDKQCLSLRELPAYTPFERKCLLAQGRGFRVLAVRLTGIGGQIP